MNDVIVMFGDSTTALTEGMAVSSEILESRLSKQFNIKMVNAGRKSNTTKDAMMHFEEDVLRHHPRIVTIQFGINDSAIDVWKDESIRESRVNLSEYESNLRYFIKRCIDLNSFVILMTPNSLFWTEELLQLYGKEPYDRSDPEGLNFRLKDYAQCVRNIAVQTGVELIDIYEVFKSDLQNLLVDGIHPNSNAHLVASQLLEPKIIQLLNVNKKISGHPGYNKALDGN